MLKKRFNRLSDPDTMAIFMPGAIGKVCPDKASGQETSFCTFGGNIDAVF
jgi:hypothetical protein